MGPNYAVPRGTMPIIQLTEPLVEGVFQIQARYRFCFIDLTLLLNADPVLATACHQKRATDLSNAKLFLSLFAEAGVLKPFADALVLDDLAQVLWLVGDFWLVFKEPGGADFGPADTEQGVRLFHSLLTPHFKGDMK